MSAFDKCRELESASRHHLERHLIKEIVFDGQFVRVEKGNHARMIQATLGDYIWNSDGDTAWATEHKCEYANDYGNLFLETFSNLSRGKPGWLWTLESDLLLYHFVRDGKALLMGLPRLRGWLFEALPSGRPRVHMYAHKPQEQHEQLNDTWGYCVRIEHIKQSITVREYDVPSLQIPEYEEARRMRIESRGNGQSEMFQR